MRPFNLVGNTGYYGPDYIGLFYCAFGLFLIFWGILGLLRIRKDKRLLAMREAVGEWAFFMGAMFEDCTYLSQESWDKDAKSHLGRLVELVGEWIPPEIKDDQARRERLRVWALGELGKCPECGGPATLSSGLCRDCHQGKLEAEEVRLCDNLLAPELYGTPCENNLLCRDCPRLKEAKS